MSLVPTHSSQSGPAHQPKGFFDLPRELRDRIYELTYIHKEHSPRRFWCGEHVIQTYLYTTAEPPLRLVCRQFTKEYDARAPAEPYYAVVRTGAKEPPTETTDKYAFWLSHPPKHVDLFLNTWSIRMRFSQFWDEHLMDYVQESIDSILGQWSNKHPRSAHVRLFLRDITHLGCVCAALMKKPAEQFFVDIRVFTVVDIVWHPDGEVFPDGTVPPDGDLKDVHTLVRWTPRTREFVESDGYCRKFEQGRIRDMFEVDKEAIEFCEREADCDYLDWSFFFNEELRAVAEAGLGIRSVIEE